MDRDFTSVSPDADLAEVLPAMPYGGECVLVVEDGRPLGLLSSENLSNFLLLRSAGLQPIQT
jgi:CBS domain-containing protein